MSLESGSYIKDLVSSNPTITDPKAQGDDHLRLIKNVLKTQFSGFTQGKPITLTEDQLNSLNGTALSAGWLFENSITLTTNYTITSNKNAGNFGPVEIADGFSLTVPPGSTFTTV